VEGVTDDQEPPLRSPSRKLISDDLRGTPSKLPASSPPRYNFREVIKVMECSRGKTGLFAIFNR